MAACVSNERFGERADYGNVLSNGDAYVNGSSGQSASVASWGVPEATMTYWQHNMGDNEDYCMGCGGVDWPGADHGWTGISDWRNVTANSDGMRGAVASRPKRRFCTSFPDVGLCRRGNQCAFAHSREELSVPLLDVSEENQDPAALTDAFFMYKYKTRWCPVGVQHEWHTCVYAHNYQDARRPVSIGYGTRLCPYWSKKDTVAEYSQRCPLGLRCPYAHGAKEQLYHPHYFKTVICRDLRAKACPRQGLCAFYHNKQERRPSPNDCVDYTTPLQTEALPTDWIAEFLSPPFLPEVFDKDNAAAGGCFGDNGVSRSEAEGNAGSTVQYAQMPSDGGQGPYVLCGPGQGALMYYVPVASAMTSPMHAAQPSPWVTFVPMDSNGGCGSPMRSSEDANVNGSLSQMNVNASGTPPGDDSVASSPRF